jgi:Ran GTPase-activating protein (RanGAP) involved in mRNA processing and transport
MWKSEEKLNKLYYVTFHVSSQQYRSTKDTKRVQSAASAASDDESLTKYNSDLVNTILDYLNEKDIFNTASVSKRLKEIIDARNINQGCSKRITDDKTFDNQYTKYRQHINLSGCISNDSQFYTVVNWISKSENLKSLNLSKNEINPMRAKALADALGSGNAVLTDLDISWNELCGINIYGGGTYDPSGIQALAAALGSGSAVLTSIDVGYNDIGKEQALSLVSIFKEKDLMKIVGLAECNLGADGAKAVADYVSGSAVLKSLDISDNNLVGMTDSIEAEEVHGDSKEVGAKVTYQGREMTVINGIDRDGELVLADFSGVYALANAVKFNAVLTTLNLLRNRIGPAGAKALAATLTDGRAVLTDLNLQENYIGTEGAKALAAALSGGRAVLTDLNLVRNQLCGLDMFGRGTYDATGIQALTAALSSGSAVLTSLDVGDNRLGEEAALGIVKVARQHDKMTFLGLAVCEIGPAGAKEIAEYVSVTAVLKSLDLSANAIKDEGAIALAEGLKHNKSLTHLNLSARNGVFLSNGFCITEKGAAAIADMLKVNAVLTTLDLSFNKIGTDGAVAIADALKSGMTVLTNLNLLHNNISNISLFVTMLQTVANKRGVELVL